MRWERTFDWGKKILKLSDFAVERWTIGGWRKFEEEENIKGWRWERMKSSKEVHCNE